MRHGGASFDDIRAAFRWQIPERFNIAHALCARHAAATPDAPALIFAERDGRARTFTYRDIDDLSARLAHVLTALGVTPGTVVGLNLPQCPETIITHLAVARMGAIVLPLAVLFGPEALRYRLDDSGARVLITSLEGDERARTALADLPTLRHSITVADNPRADAMDFWSLIDKASANHAIVDTASSDPAILLYTSGTTGQPKGVLHAHRMPIASTTGMSYAHDLFPQPGDRMWTPADWAWAGGLNALWTTLIHGRAIVAASAQRFDPEQAVELMHRHRVRNAFIPPTALRMMRALPADRVRQRCDLRSLMSGGEAMGSDMVEWGRDVLGVTFSEGYGLTEAFIPIGNCPSLFPVRWGSMGRALPGHDIAVLDDGGQPVPDGTRGQLALRRPNPLLFLEYWRNPDATAAKFRNDWCLFADVATRDAEGYIWFHGRNDDVIKSSGYRIGPQEVEDCLLQHPAVRHAGVVGTPDALRGEIVTAFVVPSEGSRPDDALVADLQEFVRRRLAAHEYPRKIHFLAEMPLTVTGKIRRLDLRTLAARIEADACPSSPPGP